jgi:hypothetical protein
LLTSSMMHSKGTIRTLAPVAVLAAEAEDAKNTL